jgi:hypothetical protein
LAARRFLQFVVAGHWHEAAPLFEGVTKERLGCYRFDACVERCQLQFLERLALPEWDKRPAHHFEISLMFVFDERVNQIGRANVEARLHVGHGSRTLQLVHRVALFPRVVLGGTTAH